MAVDTLEKKFSMMDWGDVGGYNIPVPDTGFDQGDRQHLLNSYSGILWGAAVIVEPPYVITANVSDVYGISVSVNNIYDITVEVI